MILWLYYSSFGIISSFRSIEQSYGWFDHQTMDVILRILLHECSSRKIDRNALINEQIAIFLAGATNSFIENISSLPGGPEINGYIQSVFNQKFIENNGKNKNVAVHAAKIYSMIPGLFRCVATSIF